MDEGQSRQGDLREPERGGADVSGILLEQAAGTKFLFVPYRGAGPAMTDLLAGNVDLLVVQAAAALPQVRAGHGQGLRQAGAQALARHSRHPDRGRGRRRRPAHAGLVRALRAEGHAEGCDRQAERRDGAGARRSRDPEARFADLGLDVASREQQTPEGLAAFHKAEIEKWWPIIKAAGIKAE